MVNSKLILGLWETEYPEDVFRQWKFTPEKIEIFSNKGIVPEFNYTYQIEDKRLINAFGETHNIVLLEENKMILENDKGERQEFVRLQWL